MGLLENYLQKEIKRLEKEWQTLTTEVEKLENKNLRQEMIDTIAFYLMDKSDSESLQTIERQLTIPDVMVRYSIFEKLARYIPLQWWVKTTSHCNKTTWKYVLTGKHKGERKKLGFS